MNLIPFPYQLLAAALALALTACGSYIAGSQHQRKADEAAYNVEKLAQSKATLAATESAFRGYQDAVTKAHQASSSYQQSIAALGSKISNIKLRYTDYARTHPLSADCRLDPYRVQYIEGAIDAANLAAQGSNTP